MPGLIYIVEDDRSIAELIRYNLEGEGYKLRVCSSGEELFNQVGNEAEEVGLFILDVMLPGQNGFDICRRLLDSKQFKASSFLFLTALDTVQDKLTGFAAGADDYLTKPFSMQELSARVRVLMERYRERRELIAGLLPDSYSEGKLQREEAETIVHGDLLLDDIRHRLYKANKQIQTTLREYELLKFLMINKGIAFTRDELLNKVWGYDYGGESRTVDVHIRQLRLKIEDNPAEPKYLETIRGLGYRFAEESKNR